MASLRMVWLAAPQLRQVQCFIIPGIKTCTVAILAQDTNWAVAATHAFLVSGSIPAADRLPSLSKVWQPWPPPGMCDCHEHAVAMDVDKTPG